MAGKGTTKCTFKVFQVDQNSDLKRFSLEQRELSFSRVEEKIKGLF